MVDVCVKDGAAWACAGGRALSDVLLPVDEPGQDPDQDQSDPGQDGSDPGPVLLEQTAAGSPCVLTLRCGPAPPRGGPAPPRLMARLQVVSSARTLELYDPSGGYCATVRGEPEPQGPPEDGRPLYRKQLLLDPPSTSCDLKLLSLSGRSSVLIGRIQVSLRPAPAPVPARGPNIDMDQVQVLVEELGTGLSPGAQNLMDMVQFQQKNQTCSLSGFLPLLLSGAARAGPPGSVSSPPPSAGSSGSTPPVDEPAALSTAWSSPSSSSSPDSLRSDSDPSAINHAHLTQMMSQLLTRGPSVGPDLLPALQSVCAQVTRLRLDHGAAETRTSCSGQLDAAMERRLDEMERRLKEHVDRRLDALETKLETVLMLALQEGGGGASGGGGATGGGGGATRGGGGGATQQEAPAAATQ